MFSNNHWYISELFLALFAEDYLIESQSQHTLVYKTGSTLKKKKQLLVHVLLVHDIVWSWTVSWKKTSLLNLHEHQAKVDICSASSAMVTSLFEWNIFEIDKPTTTTQNKRSWLFLFPSFLCLFWFKVNSIEIGSKVQYQPKVSYLRFFSRT